MSSKTKHDLIRYFAYLLEFLLLLTLQCTPRLFPRFFGAAPLFLAPAACLIAMYEPVVPSIFIGVFAGLLLDFSGGGILGFHATVLAILCYFIASLCEEYLQTNFVTALILGVVSVFLVVLLNWIFLYFLPGYSFPGYAFARHYLTSFAVTAVFVTLLYLINRLIAVTIHE